MKKILILGAGVYQLPLIKKARKMGLYTVVVSIPGSYPGFDWADKVYYKDTTDEEAVLEIARKEAVDGILTCGTDVAIRSIGRVCDTLGLKGISEAAAGKSCNKILMKDALSSAGVACAKYKVMSLERENHDAGICCKETENHDAAAACEEIGYPVVIKAVDSSGSRGITIVKDKSMIAPALDAVREVTRSSEYLIEECLMGEELGADAFVLDGKVQFVLPHGKYVYRADTGVPVGHYVPYENAEVSDKTVKLVSEAIEAMGFDNCAVNADIMLNNGEPYILEIGARAGATMIPELISIYNGYDYYEKLIQAALGEEVDFARSAQASFCGAARLLISEKDGIVRAISDNIPEDIRDNIYDIRFDIKPKDKVNAFKIGPDRIGHVVTWADTLAEAEKMCQSAYEKIEVEL